MNKFAKRLLDLATLLESVPRKRFNMSNWFAGRGKGLAKGLTPECGTVACVMGWACSLPVVKREGWRPCPINQDGDFPAACIENIKTGDGVEEMAKEIFGLTEAEFTEIAHRWYRSDNLRLCETPKAKARQIRDLVAKKYGVVT